MNTKESISYYIRKFICIIIVLFIFFIVIPAVMWSTNPTEVTYHNITVSERQHFTGGLGINQEYYVITPDNSWIEVLPDLYTQLYPGNYTVGIREGIPRSYLYNKDMTPDEINQTKQLDFGTRMADPNPMIVSINGSN
jgi:hypothetical protein